MNQKQYDGLSPAARRLLRKAHADYQRAALAKDPASLRARMPSPEVRGARRARGKGENSTYAQTFHEHWFANANGGYLRPNFWKAFTASQMDYQAFFERERRNHNPYIR